MLDPVSPDALYPVYDHLDEALGEQGILQTFRGVHGSTFIALDGTWYYSSNKIHCPNCSKLEHANGEITYYHSAVTPVIVAPGKSEVIPLRPEFIIPQDGHIKQDCEIAASKRWLEKNTGRYLSGTVTLLGNKGAPLAEGADALKVSWFELTVTNSKGEQIYRNAWITDWEVGVATFPSWSAARSKSRCYPRCPIASAWKRRNGPRRLWTPSMPTSGMSSISILAQARTPSPSWLSNWA